MDVSTREWCCFLRNIWRNGPPEEHRVIDDVVQPMEEKYLALFGTPITTLDLLHLVSWFKIETVPNYNGQWYVCAPIIPLYLRKVFEYRQLPDMITVLTVGNVRAECWRISTDGLPPNCRPK